MDSKKPKLAIWQVHLLDKAFALLAEEMTEKMPNDKHLVAELQRKVYSAFDENVE